MRIRDLQGLQYALHGPVLAPLPMQRIEGNIGPRSCRTSAMLRFTSMRMTLN